MMENEHDYEIGLFFEGSASGQTMKDVKENDMASSVASGVIYMAPGQEQAEDYPTLVVAIGPRVSDVDKSMRAVFKRASNIRNAFDAIAKRLYSGEKMSSTPRIYDKEGRVYDLTTSGIQLERVKTLYMESIGDGYRDNTLYFLPRPEQPQNEEPSIILTPTEQPIEPQTPQLPRVPSNGPEMRLSFFKVNF